MNSIKGNYEKMDCNELEVSSYCDEISSHDIQIDLKTLKVTFQDIININTYHSRFPNLIELLHLIIKKIDFVMANMNEKGHKRSSSKSRSYEEKKTRDSIKSKKGNLGKAIEEFIFLTNNLFKNPNLYILYSDEFRRIFRFFDLFNQKINNCLKRSLLENEDSSNMISNSNNSILENLLN